MFQKLMSYLFGVPRDMHDELIASYERVAVNKDKYISNCERR